MYILGFYEKEKKEALGTKNGTRNETDTNTHVTEPDNNYCWVGHKLSSGIFTGRRDESGQFHNLFCP